MASVASIVKSLRAQQKILERLRNDLRQEVIEAPMFRQVMDEITAARQAMPDLPTLGNVEDRGGSGHVYYWIDPILAYLSRIIARLEDAQLEQATPETMPRRDFTFVKDESLRAVLQSDYREMENDVVVRSWKSVIILCGALIEGMLTDALGDDPDRARETEGASKKADLLEWDLNNLILVAVNLGVVTAGVEKLSHSLREYRNLIHPGNQVRRKLTFDENEASIARSIFSMVYRDLARRTAERAGSNPSNPARRRQR